jgi:hypothetical protein
MKIRQGFVSNSSSSNFVIVTDKENHQYTLRSLPEFVRAVVDSLEGKKVKFLGKDCFVFSVVEGDYSTFENVDVHYTGEIPENFVNEEGDLGAYKAAWQAYLEGLKRNGDVIINQMPS